MGWWQEKCAIRVRHPALPMRDESFDQILSSHVVYDENIFREFVEWVHGKYMLCRTSVEISQRTQGRLVLRIERGGALVVAGTREPRVEVMP